MPSSSRVGESMLRSPVPRRRCALERGCWGRGGGWLLLLDVFGVGVLSVFEGRIEARRPGTGKKNFEVLPMAADGGGRRRWWWLLFAVAVAVAAVRFEKIRSRGREVRVRREV